MGYETRVNQHVLEVRAVLQPSLAAASGGAAARPNLITGIDSGPVRVEACLLEAPPAVDVGGWDEGVELSLRVDPGGVVVLGMEDDDTGLPRIGGESGGDYRLRIYARGRSLAYDATVSAAVETYRIEAWPAPLSALEVLATDRAGRLPDLVQYPDVAGAHVGLDHGVGATPVEVDRERMQRERDNLMRMSRRRPE